MSTVIIFAMAKIVSIASHLPEDVLTNNELSSLFPEWSADKIFDKTGIRQRHIAKEDDTSITLGLHAAKKLIESSNIEVLGVECIIFLSQTPPSIVPSASCLLHDLIGLKTSCRAYDLIQGCSGYPYALSLASGLIDSGQVNNVIVISSDTYSKIIDPTDRSLRTLFGDAATATLLIPDDPSLTNKSCQNFYFGTNASKASAMCLRENSNSLPFLSMDGPEILSFTLSTIPSELQIYLTQSKADLSHYDYFIFHQANEFILRKLFSKCKLSAEKALVHIETTGNTVSSSIPLVLEAILKQSFDRPMRCLLVGYGVGLSWSFAEITI